MALTQTYRRTLRERAEDQYGYVTTRDAQDLGVPSVELRKLTQRGGIEHVAHGLYRFDDIPRSGREQFMEAVLRLGAGAYLTADAVLALHDLGLVNPRRLRVAAPQRPRRALPDFIEVVPATTADSDRTWFEGIPVTTVARALFDCRGRVMTDRLIEAAERAAEAGLVRRTQLPALLDALRAG